MNAYFDTGVLVPLYVTEVFSPTVHALTVDRNEPIPFSPLHHLECENAVRLRLFRGEINASRLDRTLLNIQADIDGGRLVVRPVNWFAALDRARVIAGRVTAGTGCRTLDLIHVAIAIQWGCSLFVTADDRQLAAARQERLDTVDVRALHRRHGGASAGPRAVQKGRAPYRARERTRRTRHVAP